jgi:hypothetical protein
VSLREKTTRYVAPLGFFLALFTWIAVKVAVSFPAEFPRLSLLCKWDCGWYESIARQGYLSPIPPLFQNSELSNVAFFPAYPLLGRAVSGFLRIPLRDALPLVSILCTILLSILLSRLLSKESRTSRGFRYALLLAYPASFYLFVSYSEALYLAAMFGGIALLLAPPIAPPKSGRRDLALLAGAGLVLGGTRLTGFVIPSFLLLGAGLLALRSGRLSSLFRDRLTLRAGAFLAGAGAGIVGFFAFCAARFGYWNLYFWQLRLGWYKEFSPAKALAILLHAPFRPTLDYATLEAQSRSLSWMLITMILVVGIYAGARALKDSLRALSAGDRPLLLRGMLVLAALVHFFIVVCGDVGPWDIWGNGLRYPMPTVYLLTLLWRDEWTPAFIRERPLVKNVALALAGIVFLYLFALQVGYLGRFIRMQWVS